MTSTKRRVTRRDLFASGSNFIALGFGAGLAPIAPGTVGTLLGAALYIALAQLTDAQYVGAVAFALLCGAPICARAAQSLRSHDHAAIVWDEVVGLWIALCFVPPSLGALVGAIVLFRFFDIIKPWPINIIDKRVGGGWGIMLDDALAGAFTNVALHIILALVAAWRG